MMSLQTIEETPRSIMLTIDLEDWHQLMHRKLTGQWIEPTSNVDAQTNRLLDLLDSMNARATFFVLGDLAKRKPHLVRAAHERGHEIASHSFLHPLLYPLSKEDFRQEIQKSVDVLQDITGKKVRGFRAPEFSIRESNLHLLQVLAEMGFDYDSSIFPVRARRYGYPEFPQRISKLSFENNLSLYEIPLTALDAFGTRIPVGGGGYFRLFPQFFLNWSLRNSQKKNIPLCLYFHPYEFSANYLDVKATFLEVPNLQRFRANLPQNIGRSSVPQKLAAVTKTYRFQTCLEVIQDIKNIENSAHPSQTQPLHQFASPASPPQ